MPIINAATRELQVKIVYYGPALGGKTTNISFDPRNNSIEVDNNYFENAFHPIPNTATGFDHDGSTGALVADEIRRVR